MTESGADRDGLIRYLRQRRELGEVELFLERMDAAQAIRAVKEWGREAGVDGPQPGVGSAKPARARSVHGEPEPEAAGSEAFEAFRREVLSCTRCRLAESRRTVVFGEGDPGADLMVVGEAPGGQEDRTGRPFVGPAGRLLNKMLGAIGFDRSEVFICNVLKCRPPKNRDPWPDEVASCKPYLQRQIEAIRPVAICAFGRFAAQTLAGRDHSLSRMRGTVHEYMGIPLVVTYHPAALLRNERWKRGAWEDLQLLRRTYDGAGGRPPRGDDG